MPVAGGGRRVGLLLFALLLAPALILSAAPLDLGSVRVAGLSVLWWYAFGVGPAVASTATAILLLRGAP